VLASGCGDENPTEELVVWQNIFFEPLGATAPGPTGFRDTDDLLQSGETVEVFVARECESGCLELLESSCDMYWTEDGRLEVEASWLVRSRQRRVGFGLRSSSCPAICLIFHASCGTIVVPDGDEFDVLGRPGRGRTVEIPIEPGWR
jgi:hypothetical protein